jgi:anti-sigma regulatory factor (Ser/Thr protein kinase)
MSPVVRQTSKTFENTEDAPVQARRFVSERLSAWGLAGISERVVLAVSELTTNAVVHGGGRITLTVGAKGDRVRVTVEDEGGREPVMQGPGTVGGVAGGGWGLRIVDTIADKWGTESRDRGTLVWFEHRLATE